MSGVYFNIQIPAPLAVLALLGTALALLLVALVMLVLLVRRRLRLAGLVALFATVGIGFYLCILLLLSASSRERVAQLGEEKYFCEVDCHLAYSVVDVSRLKALGPPGLEQQARGEFVVVRLKTRFDEETIASWRPKDLPLQPNRRAVTLLDGAGRRYSPSVEGRRALEQTEGSQPPLSQTLTPGESYTTALVFDVPEDARNLKLLVTEGHWATGLLIGHENSFLHKKTFFALEKPAAGPSSS